MQEIAAREQELKGITNSLLSASDASVEGRLKEIRQFVVRGISDLRTLLNRDTVLAKAEIHKHLREVRMTPTENREAWLCSEALRANIPETPVVLLINE